MGGCQGKGGNEDFLFSGYGFLVLLDEPDLLHNNVIMIKTTKLLTSNS